MPSFRVVTDSTADLPLEWRERYGIEVVPLTVSFGDESFKDRVDLSDEQFFDRLSKASELPKTAAPAPGEFLKVYERLSKESDGIISIHIGKNLSATADAARVAAEQLGGFPVEVIDTGSVSMTLAFLCRIAAESASLQEAVAQVTERLPKLRIIALLDTLRYIEMGGRVGRAQAMIGTMLDLKPMFGVSREGIQTLDRVRTRGRAIPRMVELLLQDQPLEHLAVMHAQAPEEAERLREQVRGGLPGLEIEIGQIGCVLGTHTGPRALGFVYIKR